VYHAHRVQVLQGRSDVQCQLHHLLHVHRHQRGAGAGTQPATVDGILRECSGSSSSSSTVSKEGIEPSEGVSLVCQIRGARATPHYRFSTFTNGLVLMLM